LRQFVDSVVENSQFGDVPGGNDRSRIISQMSEVRGMLGEIEGISKQTNLARAQCRHRGGAGPARRAEGFAVVADEVRDLSGRTSHFSQQIRGSLSKMQATIEATERGHQPDGGPGHDLRTDLEERCRACDERHQRNESADGRNGQSS
jgi:methyl-accepting chemotaxis protein